MKERTTARFFFMYKLSFRAVEEAKKRNMKEQKNKLYSYKMARATGFAPNPYFGVLTLAACKPDLRSCISPGNWLAGWTSKSLKTCPTEVGKEQLVYLARVARKLTYAEYWTQYPEKRPDNSDRNADARHGDNIYEPAPGCLPDPLQPDTFILHASSHNKTEAKKAKDLAGEYVLVCEEFYYFGAKDSLKIPADIRPEVPRGQAKYGKITENASRFIGHVKAYANECKNNIISNNQRKQLES